MLCRLWRASASWRYIAERRSTLTAERRCSFRPNQHQKCRVTQASLAGQKSLLRKTSGHADHPPDAKTIYALSTAPGRAAIAIVRISGPACLDIYGSLCPGRPHPTPRQAIVRTLYAPGSRLRQEAILDRNALVLYFAGPNTVTGEDVLELHIHGGPAIVQAVLRAVAKCNTRAGRSISYAEPGEFTRCAFENGKLDLTQVEALGDSLTATTEEQRKLSIRGSAGHLAKQYEHWRAQLLLARGELEALIDFSEDQHFEESVPELLASVGNHVERLLVPLRAHIQNAMRGELLRDGIQISLLGAPNAGKSSLLNRIVGREAAIVSHEAGTTRDVVEVGLDVGGFFCRLGDTAGLRSLGSSTDTSDSSIGQVEQEGMRRARERAFESDVVVVVIDLLSTEKGIVPRLDTEVYKTATELIAQKVNVLVVLNKTDLIREVNEHESATSSIVQAIPGLSRSRVHPVSCLGDGQSNQEGIQEFLEGLTAVFKEMTSAIAPGYAGGAEASVWQESLGATIRHRLLLEQTVTALQQFLRLAQPPPVAAAELEIDLDDSSIVLAAEHLRDAANRLAKITGRGESGDVEEVLGVVFEKFCVGK